MATQLKIKRLHPGVMLPKFAHATDAGIDLYLPEDLSLAPNEQQTVALGIAVELPSNTVGLLWEKSSRGAQGLQTFGGVIDEGYRGEVKAILKNTTAEMLSYAAGTPIVQLLVQPILRPDIQEITEVSETTRGTGGFGSTHPTL